MINNNATNNTPSLWVRDVPVFGDTILAPMARYSDVPYRALCRVYGSAMSYTEFVPASALLRERNPMWRRLDIRPGGETPMVFQIFDYDPKNLLAAAQRIESWGPDIIDINMGCSAPQISDQGAGVGMMQYPHHIAETFRLLSRHLSIPVTGKIRLGWDATSKNYLEIAHIMEDNGAALIAIHGRTREQKYRGQADWDAIAALKQAVSIPVIGNGDVKTVADIDRLKAYTGCDAVMIGRAAVGNPWIFRRQPREMVTFADLTAVIRRHLHEMVTYYGEADGLYKFNRHLKQYLAGLALKPYTHAMIAAKELHVFNHLLCEMETAVPTHESIATLKKVRYFQPPSCVNYSFV
jgi:tRNA-dihydrouridine synthase B